MAKKHLSPVSPGGRSDKGPGGAPDIDRKSDLTSDASDSRHRNLEKQGRQGNIAVNTHHQGHQQDR
jgi:hypothetical protein